MSSVIFFLGHETFILLHSECIDSCLYMDEEIRIVEHSILAVSVVMIRLPFFYPLNDVSCVGPCGLTTQASTTTAVSDCRNIHWILT